MLLIGARIQNYPLGSLAVIIIIFIIVIVGLFSYPVELLCP